MTMTNLTEEGASDMIAGQLFIPGARNHYTRPYATDFATTQRITLGMPHLSPGGLSENWLLKECGNIHWSRLAELQGLKTPSFRDEEGRRLFAAFVHVGVKGAKLYEAAENDELEITSDISHVSTGRYASRHVLLCNDREIGVVTLQSIFLRRTQRNDNLILERGLSVDEEETEFAPKFHAKNSFKKDQDALLSAKIEFRPCIYSDFNGGGLLYFASYQSMFDRAEAQVLGSFIGSTVERDINYSGNLNLGDSVYMEFCIADKVADLVTYSVSMRRKSDLAIIGQSHVVKRVLRRCEV